MSDALEQASLIMVPSGYENGTLGSLKPLDGSGDFTFSRGSNLAATRVNEQGYIEKGYENFLLQSNSFLTSPWEIQFGSHTLTSGQLGYDGTNDAWLVQKESSVNHYVKQSISVSGINTFSFYAKNNTTNGAGGILIDSGLGGVVFNLENGTIYYQTGVNASIEPINNDWYRCSFTFNGSSSLLRFQVVSASGSDDVIGKSIYIQDAMLNQGMVSYPYVETTTAPVAGGILEDEPRLDYSGSCPALLLEPQRTNLWINSEYLAAAKSQNSGSSVTQNTSETLSPEGLYNASKLSGVGTWLWRDFISVQNVTSTISGYIKAVTSGSNNTFRLSIAGLISDDLTATDEWQRFSFTALGAAQASGLLRDLSGNNADLYIYGFQVELDATYPTSYIPTYGTSQTRLADVCGGAGNASTFNDNEGVLYAEISVLANDGTFRNISISNGTFSQAIRIYYRNNDDEITIFLNSDSGGNTTISIPSATDYIKLVVKYDTDTIKIFINGVLEDTLSSLIMPTGLQQLDFSRAGSLPFYGNTKQLTYFPTALSDDECIALTTIS